MKRFVPLALCVVWFVQTAGAQEVGSVVAPGAQLKLLADGFIFTEGPASDAEGNVYFTDQPNDQILCWSTEGKLSTYMKPCGRSNGLCFDAVGNLWACADEKNELWRIDKEGKKMVAIDRFEGRLLNAPNDLWISPSGLIYFTDPYYKRSYWARTEGPHEIRGVYCYNPKTGKRLYCEMGSDGMTIDNRGNVYLTNRGVTVFNPKGEQIEHIEVPEGWTANVCFGGKDRATLFITAKKGLYGMKMSVRGVGSQ